MAEQYQADVLKERTKQFTLRIIRLFRALPKTDEARILGKQALRSGTSVAANYRSACRARSRSEFVARLGIVVEEINETVLWLELLTENATVEPKRMTGLLQEANELLAIFGASQGTARRNSAMRKSANQLMSQSANVHPH